MAEPVRQPNKSVLIACKLPNGVKLTIQTPRGPESVVLKGNAFYRQPNPDRKFENPELMEAFSLTSISSDFWEAWKKEHREYPPFKNGFIQEANSHGEMQSKTREMSAEKTGLEQLDPKQFGVAPLSDKSGPMI